jgi:hypothetical protein
MDGYTPGEQPAPGARVIKLNTNENPFPPSPKVLQAIREMEPEMLRRYPSPAADSFRKAAAKLLGVDAEMILAGNGSEEDEKWVGFSVYNCGFFLAKTGQKSLFFRTKPIKFNFFDGIIHFQDRT